MDIWHVIPTTNPGGVELNAKYLITDFPIKANHTIFSTSNVDGILLKDFRLKVDVRKLFNQKDIRSIPRTIRLFKRNKPEAIIIHTFNTSLLIFILIAKLSRVAKIIILVGNPPSKDFLFKLRIFIFFLRILNVPLVCCSKHVLEEFKKISKLPHKSLTIRHGINILKSDFIKTQYFQIFPGDIIVVDPNSSRIKNAGIIGNAGNLLSVLSFLLTSIVLITSG